MNPSTENRYNRIEIILIELVPWWVSSKIKILPSWYASNGILFVNYLSYEKASTGVDTNTSQFFFTLDKAEELTSRNTIFGKIVGDTIFNLIKISESETDKDERPLYSVKIISVEVLHNPFEDIVPRTTPEERKEQLEQDRIYTLKGKDTRPKGKKDSKLLSFGDEEEEDAFVFKKNAKSSHDLKGNSKLSQKPVVDVNELDKSEPIVPLVKIVKKNVVVVKDVVSEDDSESESDTDKNRQKT